MGRTFRLIKYKKPYENTAEYPSVAQLDNATDSDSGEWGFKSLRVGQKIKDTIVVVSQLVEKVQHMLGFLLFLWYNKSGDENVGKES